MKPSLLIGMLLVFTLTYRTQAQQADSTRLVYSQEIDSLPAQSANRQAKAVYRRFIRAQIEEKTLIKIGVLPTTVGVGPDLTTNWGLKSEIGIEHKLTPALSIFLAGRSQYRRVDLSQRSTAVLNGVLAGRWYFNMPQRIRQQKSANNFSDQYLTLEINQQIWHKRVYTVLIPAFPKPGPLVRLAFGAQRRLGRFGYLDTSIGANYLQNRPRPFDISLTFMVGLGL